MNERQAKDIQAFSAAVATAAVSLSCLAAGLAPIQAETPRGNADNNSQTLDETIPGVETDEAYVNNEFDWTANPAAVQKTLEETGLPPAQVGGYSVIIGRDSIQVVGSDGQLTSPAPVPVDFVTTSGLGFDSKGDPVVQDNLITVDPETGESIRIPLYRGIETDDNGRQWVVQGYFKDTEDIDGTTLTKYPQSASKDIEEGKPTFMLFYPTPYINALLYRDPEDTTPIRVDIKPDSSQNVVSVATPFSNQVIDISYNPAIPEAPQISPTVAPELHPDRITDILTNYNPPGTDINLTMPTKIVVDMSLYNNQRNPWHAINVRPGYTSNETNEGGADTMAHVFFAALHLAYINQGGTATYSEYLNMVQEAQKGLRPYSEVAIELSGVYNNNNDEQHRLDTNTYKVFPRSVKYLIVDANYDPTTELNTGASIHLENWDPTNNSADLIIHVPVDVLYDMRSGQYATAQIVEALSKMSHQPTTLGFDSPLGTIAFGPKTEVPIPGSDKKGFYYPSPIIVTPQGISE